MASRDRVCNLGMGWGVEGYGDSDGCGVGSRKRGQRGGFIKTIPSYTLLCNPVNHFISHILFHILFHKRSAESSGLRRSVHLLKVLSCLRRVDLDGKRQGVPYSSSTSGWHANL